MSNHYIILSRLSRFKTNYVTYEIHLLKHLKHTFLSLAAFMFTVHLIKILGTVIIFRLFCVNAKIIYAKFVTKKYNDLFKCENEKNNGMFRGMLHKFF